MGKAELARVAGQPRRMGRATGRQARHFPAMVSGLPTDLRAIYRNTRGGPALNHDAFEVEMAKRGVVQGLAPYTDQ